ncbi:hypothetical protein ANN_11456 [Periplaneta americana]|uniref:Uncharacterized protein n=1 Tax=Periplaneta americana TaxID=6978 RepID=A0ABQ8T7D1_PERAM|nr:hypothetical protein ANN_11456 [Periplaneta americana]
MDSEIKMSATIKDRIQAGNKAYFANLKLLKCKILTRTDKIQIYKTLIRPIVTYSAETWTLIKSDQDYLRKFERKIMGRIYGPVLDNGMWKIRYNEEINQLIKGEDIHEHQVCIRFRSTFCPTSPLILLQYCVTDTGLRHLTKRTFLVMGSEHDAGPPQRHHKSPDFRSELSVIIREFHKIPETRNFVFFFMAVQGNWIVIHYGENQYDLARVSPFDYGRFRTFRRLWSLL